MDMGLRFTQILLTLALGVFFLAPSFAEAHQACAEEVAEHSHDEQLARSGHTGGHIDAQADKQSNAQTDAQSDCHCPVHRCVSACHSSLVALREVARFIDFPTLLVSFHEVSSRAKASPDLDVPFQPPRIA